MNEAEWGAEAPPEPPEPAHEAEGPRDSKKVVFEPAFEPVEPAFEPVVDWEENVKAEPSGQDLGKKASESDGKVKKKVVKRKKKLAEDEVQAEVIGCQVDMVDVAAVVDVAADVPPEGVEVPPRMPPDLPFHFRIDVSGIKIGQKLPKNCLEMLATKMEMQWRYCRKDQERAWIQDQELPCEIRDVALARGRSVEEIFHGLRQRKEESWQKNLNGQVVRTFPMKVLRFETTPGRLLRREDLERVKEEDLWCYMIFDLSGDPVLKEIGHEAAGGATVFSALVLLYVASAREATEIRVAHVDHFEFALLFPASPYQSCKLDVPLDDLASCFQLDLSGEERPLTGLMLRLRAVLTWLFWDCFEALYQEVSDAQTTGVCSVFDGLHSYVYTRRFKELKKCQERGEALASLLSLVRAHAFQFPFRITVRKKEVDEIGGSLLAAVELACQRAITDYKEHMRANGGLLPEQWNHHPLQLKLREGALDTLVQHVEPMGMVSAELALIDCTGVIQLHQEERELDHQASMASEAEKVEIHEADHEDPRKDYEEKAMLLTVDLTNWDGSHDAELVVGDININDHNSIRETLAAVEQMEQFIDSQEAMVLPALRQKLAQLAYGLRGLQRASMKEQLRSVGLAVLETERKVSSASAWAQAYQSMGRAEEREEPCETVQRVLLMSAPELVLRRRAEVRRLRRRVLPHKASDEFLGGFRRSQFDQGGPLQSYWVETHQSPYPYRPFFQSPEPDIDPAALLSPAERKFLVKSFITDPLSEIMGPHGTVDPRQGGANMDPRQLVADGVVQGGLLHLHSQMSSIHLMNGFVYPWRYRGWRHYYIKSRCKCNTALVLHHFGPKIGSYFDFLETYIAFLLIAALLGIFAELSGPPNGHAASGFWKFVQPSFGVWMSMWGTFFCIFWRRRCGWLAHIWGNGWIEEGEDLRGPGSVGSAPTRVRPEFALQWRQGFEQAHPRRQAETLRMLKKLLRAPESQHFDDRALTSDIMRFDEACYLSDWVQLYRFLISYFASASFIALASGATYGALAANRLLGLSGTTGGYAVTGLTTSVLVPLLNVVHYQVVIKTNNYQLFREDSEREKDFFDRLFVFNLFNTYNSLLWIAFVERNMEQLRVQVFFLLLSSIFVNNLLEFFWSHFVKQFQTMGHHRTIGSSLWQTLKYLLVGEADEGAAVPLEPIQTALEHVMDEVTRDCAFELVDEAIELVIQYGLIMMFTVAFPLAPLFALINVHVEKRLDAYKLVKLMQSPEPRMVVGMGRAFNAFVIVTGLGLLVTGLLLYFARYPGEDCSGCTTLGSCGSCGGTSVELILPEADTELRLFLLSMGEHVMLMIMYACFTSVSLGKDIVHEQYRQRFYENRLQCVENANSRRRTLLDVNPMNGRL